MVAGINGALDLIFWGLAIAAFIFEVVALVHAVRTPARNFEIAGKLTKQWWLVILGFATLFGLATASTYIHPLSIFTVAAVIGAAIYMVDVRPAVTPPKGNGQIRGPW